MSILYVSGPLTGVREITKMKAFYERIGDVALELGFQPYVPHLYSDPEIHSALSASEVYQLDSHSIVGSDLVVAYVGIPAIGVGQEVEIASQHCIPVILMYEDGSAVTRMVRGNPAVIHEVVAEDLEGIVYKLALYLSNLTEYCGAPAWDTGMRQVMPLSIRTQNQAEVEEF